VSHHKSTFICHLSVSFSCLTLFLAYGPLPTTNFLLTPHAFSAYWPLPTANFLLMPHAFSAYWRLPTTNFLLTPHAFFA
jgi:hypothetical protein